MIASSVWKINNNKFSLDVKSFPFWNPQTFALRTQPAKVHFLSFFSNFFHTLDNWSDTETCFLATHISGDGPLHQCEKKAGNAASFGYFVELISTFDMTVNMPLVLNWNVIDCFLQAEQAPKIVISRNDEEDD